MRGELVLSISTLLGFVLTLIRVGGVFIFVPLPGVTAVLSPARVILSLGITMALFPEWPRVAATPSAGLFLMWVLAEAGLGIGIGLTVAFVSESLAVGAQVMGLQAGYGFATIVDPNTQADSQPCSSPFRNLPLASCSSPPESTAKSCVSSHAAWRLGPPAHSCSLVGRRDKCSLWDRA